MRLLLVCLLAAGTLTGCSGQPSAGCSIPSGDQVLMDRGQARTFRIAVPPGASADTPMVVSIHGAGGSAAGQEEVSGFTAMAAREGFIAVYPEGLSGASPINFWDASPGSGDVRFVAELIRTLHSSGCSQPSQTYVTGFSMGAMLTSRLLCEDPDLFAGAGLVGGVLPPQPGCRAADGTRIVIVHGRADLKVPYDGSLSQDIAERAGGPALANYPGVTREDMARMWAQAKGCDELVGDQQVVRGEVVTTWVGCGDAAVEAHVYDMTGHVWNPVEPGVEPTSEMLWRTMREAAQR